MQMKSFRVWELGWPSFPRQQAQGCSAKVANISHMPACLFICSLTGHTVILPTTTKQCRNGIQLWCPCLLLTSGEVCNATKTHRRTVSEEYIRAQSAVCAIGQAIGMASLCLLVKKIRDVEENKNIVLEKQEGWLNTIRKYKMWGDIPWG